MIFHGIPTVTAHALRLGMPDANGQVPEFLHNPHEDAPCRHCLHTIEKGAGMLICAHRPFETRNPYAETGPVFLCARHCAPYRGTGLPPVFTTSPDYLLKGYDVAERPVAGTGAVTLSSEIEAYCETLLAREEVAFVDIRSARNACWQGRVTR